MNSYPSAAGQGKFAGQRSTFYRWATLLSKLRSTININIKPDMRRYFYTTIYKQCKWMTETVTTPMTTARSSASSKAFSQWSWNSATKMHILASAGYAPGTIAVSVTWMEKGFNAGQTHSSIYPSLFKRLRAIARYWFEIATFFLLPCI